MMKSKISISIHYDKKGYLDRECPHKDCHYVFKVLGKDWDKKISNREAYCPMCRNKAPADQWYTQSQQERIDKIAKNQVRNNLLDQIERPLMELARATRKNSFIKITYTPARRIVLPNTVYQRKAWETEICCEKCGMHYSVIGTAYFCPCCGHNSAVNSFNDSLNAIKIEIDSLADMKKMLMDKHNADIAETKFRQTIESSICLMVSAFQKFACSKYEELLGHSSSGNDFQIIDKGSHLFEEVTGKKYSDWLSDPELDFMKKMFQRRHLLEHCNGIVDERYIEKSGDTSYSPGQRIVIKKKDAYRLLDILKKLGDGLIKLQPMESPNETTESMAGAPE